MDPVVGTPAHLPARRTVLQAENGPAGSGFMGSGPVGAVPQEVASRKRRPFEKRHTALDARST